MPTDATDPRLPGFSSQDLLQATTTIITALEALKDKYGLETVLILTRGTAEQPRFSRVHASRKADRFLRDVIRMDVGILAQKIEGYIVSGSSTPGATAIALHGGATKSCIKMKQKEQIKIARDLILNGLINILREENVPEDKIPKSMNYKSYHSKIVEQCGVVLVGYPGEKGIVNPGELDALMLKELLLRLGDGRCYWGKSPGHVGDADALPSPSSSSSWTSSDSAFSILGSRQPMEHETGSGSHTSPEASSVPAESGRKSTPNTFNLDSDSMAARSWPIKSETPSMDSQHCFPLDLDYPTENFSASTTAPTLPTPSHMVPRRYNLAPSKLGVNTFLSPTLNKANNSTSIPDSTMMLSNAFLRSPPPTPQHDLQSVAFHTPPLVLDELQNRGSPHSSNPDLDLNFPRQPSYSPFQTSTDFLFSNHKAGCNDFDMADGTLPAPNTFQDIFSSPSFAIGLGVHGGQSGPLWPSSTIQPHAPWVGHMWDIQI